MLPVMQVITRDVGFARHFHALLLDKRTQQGVQRLHDFGFAANLEGAILFDRSNTFVFHIARHDGGKCPAQVGCQ